MSFACPSCGRPRELAFDEEPAACAQCGASNAWQPRAVDNDRLVACPVCGLKVLYKQKDFRQAIGCLVVLIASVLAPFTYYVSLVVAAGIDWVLYRIASEVVICYGARCHAHMRGFVPGEEVLAFDLSIHDYQRSVTDDSAPNS